MSHPSMPGFRILPMPAPIRKDIIERFESIVTPHISDNMQRLCGVIGLKSYHRQKKLVGRAVTVKVRPGDNLMIHKALDMAEPGDVIVVDGGGEITQALVGELMQMCGTSLRFTRRTSRALHEATRIAARSRMAREKSMCRSRSVAS
jgi:hypothetical protein